MDSQRDDERLQETDGVRAELDGCERTNPAVYIFGKGSIAWFVFCLFYSGTVSMKK